MDQLPSVVRFGRMDKEPEELEMLRSDDFYELQSCDGYQYCALIKAYRLWVPHKGRLLVPRNIDPWKISYSRGCLCKQAFELYCTKCTVYWSPNLWEASKTSKRESFYTIGEVGSLLRTVFYTKHLQAYMGSGSLEPEGGDLVNQMDALSLQESSEDVLYMCETVRPTLTSLYD